MDPDDLVIIDYPSMLRPPTPPIANPPIDSKESNPGTDDHFIKLNQAWEKEVKNRNNVFDLMRRLRGINCIPSIPNLRELISTLKLGQS